MQQGVCGDPGQRLAATGVPRQHFQMTMGRFVGDMRGHRPDHFLPDEFAVMDAVDDLRWAVVMDADLIQGDVLTGLRVGAQSLEDLDGNGIGPAAELLGDGVMEVGSGCFVVLHREALGCHEPGIARHALAEDVCLPGIQRFLEDLGLMDVEPQSALVLVSDPGEGRAIGVVEDVVTETLNDILPGTVRHEHDMFGHLLHRLPLTDGDSRDELFHGGLLFPLGLLGVQFRQRQIELVGMNSLKTAGGKWPSSLERFSASFIDIPLREGVNRVTISPSSPFLLLGCVDRLRSAHRTLRIIHERSRSCQRGA